MLKKSNYIVGLIMLISILITGCESSQEFANMMEQKYENISSYSATQRVTGAFGDTTMSEIKVKRSPGKNLYKETYSNGDMTIIQDLPKERIVYTYNKIKNEANKEVYSYELVGENKESQTPDFLSLLINLFEDANVKVKTEENNYIIHIKPKAEIGREKEIYYINKDSFIPTRIEYYFSDEGFNNIKKIIEAITTREASQIKRTIELTNLETNIELSDVTFEIPKNANIVNNFEDKLNLNLNYELSFGNQNTWNFSLVTSNQSYFDDSIVELRYTKGKADGIEYKKADIKTKYYEISEGDSFGFLIHYFSYYNYQEYSDQVEKISIGDNAGAYIYWEHQFKNQKELSRGNHIIWSDNGYYYMLASNNFNFPEVMEQDALVKIAETINQQCGNGVCGAMETEGICPQDCKEEIQPWDELIATKVAHHIKEKFVGRTIRSNQGMLLKNIKIDVCEECLEYNQGVCTKLRKEKFKLFETDGTTLISEGICEIDNSCGFDNLDNCKLNSPANLEENEEYFMAIELTDSRNSIKCYEGDVLDTFSSNNLENWVKIDNMNVSITEIVEDGDFVYPKVIGYEEKECDLYYSLS